MKHEISVEEGIILVIVSGNINPQGYGAVARDIVSLPQWKPGMKILVDYSYLDLKDETGADADVYAQAVFPYKVALGNGRMACVNKNPVDYGLGRMWQISVESYTNVRVGIFYTYEEAMHWLSEPDLLP